MGAIKAPVTDSNNDLRNHFKSPQDAVYNSNEVGGDSMVRHIDSELQGLKDLILQMGGCVERALENACKAVLSKDNPGLDEVYRHETKINDLQIQVDEACVHVLAKQAPVAKDLRLVIAITKINTDLERMGDQSKNIARNAYDLYRSFPQAQLPSQIPLMIDGVRAMVRSVLDAFARRDVELSRQVLKQDDRIDELKDNLIADMKKLMQSTPDHVEIGLTFIMIAKNLERMADHATNVAEEVIYLTTGSDVRHGHSIPVNS